MTDEIDFYLEQRAEQQREARAEPTPTEDPGGSPVDQAENQDAGGSPLANADSGDYSDSSNSSSDDYPASNGEGGGGANPFGDIVSRIAGWFTGAAAPREDDLVEPSLTDFSDLGVRATPLGRE